MPREIRGESPSAPARPPRRTHYPNLSPIRPRAIAADRDLWPWWTDVPIDRGGLILLDELGKPVLRGRD